MQYFVDNEPVEKVEFDRQLEDAIDLLVESTIDDEINESNDEVVINGLSYEPANVLKCVDETAYRCMIADTSSEMLSEAQHDFEVENSDVISGISFETVEDVDPEDETEEDY